MPSSRACTLRVRILFASFGIVVLLLWLATPNIARQPDHSSSISYVKSLYGDSSGTLDGGARDENSPTGFLAALLRGSSDDDTPASIPRASSDTPVPTTLPQLVLPAPSASAPPRRRHLLLLHGVEGFGAWSDSIRDTLMVAKALNRTWVEPCVRNGCLEPCRCEQLPTIPPFDAARAAAGEDPLLLPRINIDCKVDMHYNHPDPNRVSPAYPLSAYLDVDALRAEHDIITYKEWCADYTTTHGPPDATMHRWRESRAYCYEMNERECAHTARPVYVGDFFFPDGDVVGWRADGKNLELLAEDDAENIFMYVYFRGAFGVPPYHHPSVPISPWHHAAVERLIQSKFGNDGYAAFHWRSEGTVPDDLIIPCAKDLVNATARVPALLGAHPHAIIVSDMPSPGNNNKMWTDYAGGESKDRKAAMQMMMDAGFLKYDAVLPDVNNVDAGVLSVRDYLLSLKSSLYVTCAGDHHVDCHGCFRSGSNIVHRINLERERAAKPTLLKWFDIDQKHLPEPLASVAAAAAPAEPTSAPAPTFSRRYMLLLHGVEGFGAWSDSIVETLLTAKALNRTWVEPCVRNGCLEPCRCDEIPEIPPFDAARAAAGEDPLLLPRINIDCKVDMHYNHPNPAGFSPAYPLSAYLNVEEIARIYNNDTITYKEWCAGYKSKHGPYDADIRRWREPRAYCYEMNERECSFNNRIVYMGDFAFTEGDIPGWRSDGRNFEILAEDPSENIFMYIYFRGAFGMVSKYPSMPISQWHHAAVERFIAQHFKQDGYAAFHWRSERNVDSNMILPCSQELVNLTRTMLPVLDAPSHAILVSDMPSPNNPHKMWTDYQGGESSMHQAAMRTMLDGGFIKYDALLPNASGTDGGVFSIRDYLLSLKSDVYITCQGDHWADCHGCFRAGSNIVNRITQDRIRAGTAYSHSWYKLATRDLPPRLQALDGGRRSGNVTGVR